VNIDGTLNVLVAARDAKVQRFVYAASSSGYGETPTLPKIEMMQPAPISPCGVTKYVGESYAQVFGRVYGLENTSVRFFNVFGPCQDPTSHYSGVLSRFMLTGIEGKQPAIYGDGEQSRDFTYIENIVDETLRACEAKGASGISFTGGTGASITLNEVLKLLEKITGKKIQVKYDPREQETSATHTPMFRSPTKCSATNPLCTSRKDFGAPGTGTRATTAANTPRGSRKSVAATCLSA
jgi:UDP-glucose 4-epimerase